MSQNSKINSKIESKDANFYFKNKITKRKAKITTFISGKSSTTSGSSNKPTKSLEKQKSINSDLQNIPSSLLQSDVLFSTVNIKNRKVGSKKNAPAKVLNYSEFNRKDDLTAEVSNSNSSDTSEYVKNENYRIGDWVYCEFEPNQPYQIRKIEELYKNSNGELEAKLRCAFRRTDISQSLLSNLEKRYQQFTTLQSTFSFTSIKSDLEESASLQEPFYLINYAIRCDDDKLASFIQNLPPSQLFKLRLHELFYSRYYETSVSCSVFRGKCKLNLFLANVSSFDDYLTDEYSDNFFYQMTYDPHKLALSDDKALIRVGSKFQADIPELLTNGKRRLERNDLPRETQEWSGTQSMKQLSELSTKKYIIKVVESKIKLNDLYKDCTINETSDSILYEAMKHLHKSNYETKKAMSTFSYNTYSGDKKTTTEDSKTKLGSLWTDCEMKFFENGIVQFGKDFNQIKNHYLPFKSLSNIVEYYYNIYKTSEAYKIKRDEKRMNKKNKIVEIMLPKQFSSLDLENIDDDYYYDEDSNALTDYLDFNPKLCCVSCRKSKPLHQNWLNSKNLGQDSCNLDVAAIDKLQNNGVKNISNSNSQIKKDSWNINSEKDSTHVINSNDFKPMLCQEPNNRNNLFNAHFFKLNQQQSGFNKTKNDSQNLCNSCWMYWKKYGSFKYNYHQFDSANNGSNMERTCPEKRKERIKNQSYKCTIDFCGREFLKKGEFMKHATISHCLIVKSIVTQPPSYKPLNPFHLHTTPITNAYRLFYSSIHKNYFKKLGRSPYKNLVDYKSIKSECENNLFVIKSLLFKSKNKKLTQIKKVKLRPKRPIENTPPSSKASNSSTNSSPSSESSRLQGIIHRLQLKNNFTRSSKENKSKQKEILFSDKLSSQFDSGLSSGSLKCVNKNSSFHKIRSKENDYHASSAEDGTSFNVFASPLSISISNSPSSNTVTSSSSHSNNSIRSTFSRLNSSHPKNSINEYQRYSSKTSEQRVQFATNPSKN